MELDLIEEEVFHSHVVDQNVIIFGVDMKSSIHIDNKAKDILTLGIGPTQEVRNCRKNIFYQFYYYKCTTLFKFTL